MSLSTQFFTKSKCFFNEEEQKAKLQKLCRIVSCQLIIEITNCIHYKLELAHVRLKSIWIMELVEQEHY